ncbi:uncharacterized protein [Neodiprion pinetum]|uniref:Uncharacterized protein LOC107225827 n=1 Tax=Neodiprion lecontei TaxID=441921 RepID=A0A6J0C5U2_NEOLC|nr:uncharacterized protein LOC107225827 [Neodiprion lecontei]XP_046467030.1 uncharacterized protein LOC124211720 [Neodiprion pinetum]
MERKNPEMDPVRYPDLQEMFQNAGVCPICFMEMGQMPTYQCENGHTMCHRCKPYYYACSMCNAPLNFFPAPETDPAQTPPPIHFMPHMMPRDFVSTEPSAPYEDFLHHERGSWGPPSPEPEQHLGYCKYSNFGCWIRVPEYLRELHETRCHFRPFLEEEQLPTDLHPGDDLEPCAHAVVGCNVMMPPWRKPVHEPLCIFKESFEAFNAGESGLEPEPEAEGDEDPDELVECKLKIYGCRVRMQRRRKEIHEGKCNYNKYYNEEDFREREVEPEEIPEEEPEEDPDELIECKLKIYGCRVRMPRHRKESHEAKCNYNKYYREEDF